MASVLLNINMELKRKSDLHLSRKAWHMISVFLMFATYSLTSDTVSGAILLISVLVFVPMDLFRHRFPKLNEILVQIFNPIMRQYELNKLTGATYLLLGVGLIVVFFSRPVISLALLFLAFADPIASFVGIRYGKDKIFGHKSIQGFLAAYIVCAVTSFAYLSFYEISMGRLFVVSLIAGMIGALSELIPVGKLDDNFTLPVFSAIGLQILFYFFGIF